VGALDEARDNLADSFSKARDAADEAADFVKDKSGEAADFLVGKAGEAKNFVEHRFGGDDEEDDAADAEAATHEAPESDPPAN
jgi:hypothetical protein